MTKLLLHLTMRANWLPGTSKGTEINIGQFPTSLHELSSDTGISVRSIRTCLKRMVATKEITMEVTSLGRIITVRNWLRYQQLESGVDYNNEDIDKYATNKTTKKATKEPTKQKQSGLAALLNDSESHEEKTTNKTTKETTKKPTTIEEYKEYKEENKSDNKSSGKSSFVTDKKSDYLEQILDSFRAKFRDFHGRDYIITNMGHERTAAAKLLQVFKTNYPGANSETMLQHITDYFSRAISVNDKWLRNNMSIPISHSRFNAISNIINEETKNNHARSENKRPENPVSNFNTNW